MNSIGKAGGALLWAAAGVGAIVAAKYLLRQAPKLHLRGKTVLITGGSRGLGLVLARQFAVEGAKIALLARDKEELERARQELSQGGAQVLPVVCDVTDKAQVENAVAAVRAQFGPVDVLVNNAGIIQVSPLEHLTEQDYDDSLKTHFWAAMYLVNAVLPEMKERGAGRIVNVSSIGGKAAFPHMNAYAAGKFALVGYSEGLRAELKKDGVFVTTVCPGLIRTGSPVNATFKGRNDEEYAWFKLGDSLPGLTASAETCAHQIITATKNGDAELIVSLPAQILTALHGVFPGLTSDAFAVVNAFLPKPGGIGSQSVTGRESESAKSETFLTGLTDRAAERNNQLAT